MISGQPYIRKKGKRFIVERKVSGRTDYIKTLPDIKTLLELLGVDASLYYEEKPGKKTAKASQNARRLDNETQQLDDNEGRLSDNVNYKNDAP